jgi:tRNA/tmRNA/rRNA uracil-C5-methylase (TrmA/RlmC/RlmD family)
MSLLTLDIEKPAAGGRMLARYNGQIVLVSGAIPGERVTARLERTERGVAFAEVTEILEPSVDRRPAAAEARCGGNVFSHIEYPRQLRLKGEIIEDAFRRIGRLPLPEPPIVTPSPERGYRMRARLHAGGERIGFYVEGSHRVCDASATGQLLPDTCDWIADLPRKLDAKARRHISAIEIAENVPGQERACHLELHAGAEASRYTAIAKGLTGLSAVRADRPGYVQIAGVSRVTDLIRVSDDPAHVLSLSRDVRAFFQGNRFLVEQLVRRVVELVPRGPVIDLYAGVGLFGLSLAAAGWTPVTCVEGDLVAGTDLGRNAERFGGRVTSVRRSVETYVGLVRPREVEDATVIVDPPRTGISKQAIADIARLQPRRVVYISCDVATLARDTRALHDAGYGLSDLSGIDLFPNTAHVETLAVLARE